MKSRVGLFILLVFVCKNTWSDEFEIIVSRELIQAIVTESHWAASLPSLKHKHKIEPATGKSTDANVGRTRSEARADSLPRNQLADNEYIYDPITLLFANEFDSTIGAAALTKSKPGSYPREQVEQSSNNNPLFAELQQELRGAIGEEGYEKALWNYNNLKRLDDYINSSMDQFVYQSLGSSYGFLLTDWMVFEGNSTGVGFRSSSAPAAGGRTDLALSDTDSLMTGNPDRSTVESNSLLFVLLKSLTIRNSLYLLLTVCGLAYLFRGIRLLLNGRHIAKMRG